MAKPRIEKLLLPESVWTQRNIAHDGLLYHFISAINTNPENPFDMQSIRDILIKSPASCHDYIDREGVIWEFVPHQFRAWHAGRSKFRGRSHLNNSFIGIELAGTEDGPFTGEQYESLAWRSVHYMKLYPGIRTDWIRGHEDVSDHTVRSDPKVDPGQYFDWIRVGMLIGELWGKS